MPRRKAVKRKKTREPKYTIEEVLEILGEDPDSKDAVYDFGNTAVLFTHPTVNEGESVQGIFSGSWTTRPVSRTSFEITDIKAAIVLPTFDLKLPNRRRLTRVFPGSVHVDRGYVKVPKYLQELFPHPNIGTIDIRNRFYQTVFGMQVHFPNVYGNSEYLKLKEPADLLLKTVGKVEKGGALTASGIGMITSGFLTGAMFACNHGSKKKTTIVRCGAKSPRGFLCIRPKKHSGKHLNRLSGETW